MPESRDPQEQPEQLPTPNPTSTPRPTWDWATPTPYATMSPGDPRAIDAFDFMPSLRSGAELVVGIWQTANSSNAIDTIQGILMFIIVLRIARRILNEWRAL